MAVRDTKQLTDMLKRLGWGSGFRLPIANEENRKLEELLDAKQSKLVALSAECHETSMAVDNLASFITNLNSKLKHDKELERARLSQVDKERQILCLSERELAKTEQDKKKLGKQLRELHERNEILECNVVRRKNTLAELVDVIDFDKKAITAFEEKFSNEDAYMNFINEVADTDDEKAKKCQEDYRKLGETIEKSRIFLLQTVSESEVMDNELEYLAKRFRNIHAERNQTIKNWKGTLIALEARDEQIMKTCYEHNKIALQVSQAKALLEKQEAFYEQIQQHTKTYLAELSLLERSMIHLRNKKRDEEARSDDNHDSLIDLATDIIEIDKEMKSIMKAMDQLNKETENWYDKLIAAKDALDCVKAKYDLVTVEQLTSTEHYSQLGDFLEKEERKEEVYKRELEKQTNWKSQRETQIVELKEKCTLTDAKARNLKATISNCKKRLSIADNVLLKHRTADYRLDHQIMHISSKIRGYEKPETLYTTQDDFLQFQTRLMFLRDKLQDLLKNQALIKSQTQHSEQVAIMCYKDLEKQREDNRNLEVKVHRLQKESKRISKEEETLMESMKESVVTHSLVQVQMKKMLHSVQNYESKLLDLEQERLTIQTVVKSRKKDIENYCLLLSSKKHALQEESQKLRVKCHDVKSETQSRRRKYDMVLQQMWLAGNQDETSREEAGGSNRSEAYYIIKLAQEREHYKQEGDKWDQRVKEAEKIVEGLQNTLALMIGTNEVFKESLKPATANTEEGKQLQDFKDKQHEAAQNLKLAKVKRLEYRGKLTKLQGKLDEAIGEKSHLQETLLAKQYKLQGLLIEITGQKEKIKRATLQANKLIKELSKLESLDAELLQNDLRFRITREKYEFAVATLEKFLTVYPHLLEETLDFLQEKQMYSLCDRITKKIYSPSPSQSQSVVTSPHESESGTNITRSSSKKLSNLSVRTASLH